MSYAVANPGNILRRRASSDLTIGVPSSQNDEFLVRIESKLQYSELVSEAGIGDIPDFYNFMEEIPPTAPICGMRRQLPTKPQAKAVISLMSPHKFVIVTQSFCDLFNFQGGSETCDRSFKMIVGPQTDLAAISSGFQCAANVECCVNKLILYNREGKGRELEVSFSPFLLDSETLAGCLLEIHNLDSTC
jgi:hypothetical protein